jgi:uncharacterized protein YbjT (DUF2867 family)
MPNVLITGATGYVGRRLTERLLREPELQVRLLVRNPHKLEDLHSAEAEVVEGSTFDVDSLAAALKGIHTAYYLIHSMGAGKEYRSLDRQSAENFTSASITAGVKRIVYLGGLGDREAASPHLLSRIETGEILSREPQSIQTIWLRAAVIIGSGSAGFEMIRHLLQKLPLMITPRWVSSRTQPIGIEDVLDYLVRSFYLTVKGNLTVDIGAESMSFKNMLIEASRVMGLKRYLFPVPFFSPRLSSYWLILMTPVDFRIARELVEGLRTETLIRNQNARRWFPDIHPKPYAEAVGQALAEIERNQVVSRWCDSSADIECDIRGPDKIEDAVLREVYHEDIGSLSEDIVFDIVSSVGGDRGWFRHNWLWSLRGRVDKLMRGPGLSRGRRDAERLRPGDSLDFWKVVDLEPPRRLLLLSQMKLPGKVWLDFGMHDRTLRLTVHFLPRGLAGRLYWTLARPIHRFLFPATLRGIVQAARLRP